MRKEWMLLILLAALLVGGCSDETPTQAVSTDDDAIATVIAGTVGYESSGLAAAVNDMVTAADGGSIGAAMAASSRSALRVTHNDSILDPLSRRELLSIARERDRGDAYSSWQLRYTVRFAAFGQGGDSMRMTHPMSADGYVDGTLRNAVLLARGSSSSRVRFEGGDAATGRALGGSYQWKGAAVANVGHEEHYDDVTITMTWNRLQVIAGPGGTGERIVGRCDVAVNANGPEGMIARNGTLAFDGDGEAILAIGGRSYRVNVRQGQAVRSR